MEQKIKHLQLKYSLLHIFYWFSNCCVFGYLAVFLRYRGMTNTLVGLTSGLCCALSIVLTPYVTGLVGRIRGLTLKKLIISTYLITVLLWGVMVLFPLPQLFLMLLFILLGNLVLSNVPLLTTVCMNYLTGGYEVNFGLARGMGSVSYAATAVVLGILVDSFDPTVLAYMHVIATVCLIIDMLSMPDAEIKQTGKGQNKLSIFAFVRQYRFYVLSLLCFSMMFAAATSLSTYLIDIVEKLGGSTSLYGVGVFFMAASELPFMAVTPFLKKKYSTEQLLFFSILMYVARNVTIALAPNIALLFFGMTLQGLSYGIFTASITYYVHERIAFDHGMQGQTMIAVMTTGLGSTLGNLAGGMLQDSFGLSAMLTFAVAVTVLGAICYFVLTAVENKKFKGNRIGTFSHR